MIETLSPQFFILVIIIGFTLIYYNISTIKMRIMKYRVYNNKVELFSIYVNIINGSKRYHILQILLYINDKEFIKKCYMEKYEMLINNKIYKSITYE